MSLIAAKLTVRDFAFAVIIAFLAIMSLTGKRASSPKAVNPIRDTFSKTTIHIDPNGGVHEQIVGKIYTEAEMKVVKDSLQKQTGITKIVTVVKEILRIDTQFVAMPMYVDTLNHIIIDSFSGKYCKIVYIGNLATKKGSFSFDITPDTITHTIGYKLRLFKPEELEVDFQHTNALVTTVKADVFSQRIPRSTFCFGPFLGVNYLGKPTVGIGVMYNVISIKRQ